MKPKGRKTLTQQHLRDQNNIRSIMERSQRLGIRGNLPTDGMFYGDFTGLGSYHDSMNRITHAQQAFENLPSRIRLKFKNDPGQLIDFLNDPKNTNEAVELGILDKSAYIEPETQTPTPSPKKTKTKTPDVETEAD